MTSWWSRAREQAQQAPIRSLVKCTYSALLWVYSHVMAEKTIWCYINSKSLFLPTVAYPVEADFTPGMHTRSNVKYLLTPGAPVGWGCPLCCPLCSLWFSHLGCGWKEQATPGCQRNGSYLSALRVFALCKQAEYCNNRFLTKSTILWLKMILSLLTVESRK